MRVLVVTSIYPTPDNPAYGAFVRAQEENLRASGIDVDVVVVQPRPSQSRSLTSLTKYLHAIREVRRRTASGAYDVVHAHFTYCGIVARTQRRVPVVVTFHGSDVLGTVHPDGRQTVTSRLIVTRLSKWVARQVDGAIVQSGEMQTLLGLPSARIVPCEVDTDTFRPMPTAEARRALGLSPTTRYLLFAARPTDPFKRFPLAEQVAQAIADRRDDVELVVIHRETQERLALYMNACDVLLFPSFQEGSPNVVKQAMACDLPIVATDVGDVRSVIEPAANCHIAAPTIAAFTAAVERVLDTGGRSDGHRYLARFAPQVIAQQISDIYVRVVSQSTTRPSGADVRR